MRVMYAREYETYYPRPWIFLAGPTERRDIRTLWRLEVVEQCVQWDFEGTLIIPEDPDGVYKGGVHSEPSFGNQVEWEWWGLDNSDVILFWIPRDMELLPGMTTNVEFGMYADSQRVVLGAPPEAEQVSYIQKLAERNDITRWFSIENTLKEALDLANL